MDDGDAFVSLGGNLLVEVDLGVVYDVAEIHIVERRGVHKAEEGCYGKFDEHFI